MQIKIHMDQMFKIADQLQQALTGDDESIQQESLTESTYEIRLNKAEKLFQELVPKDQYPHVDDMRNAPEDKIRPMPRNNWTLLHVASYKNYVELTDFLLRKGAHIESINTLNQTPLTIAAKTGSVEVAKLLLDKGANIEAPSKGREEHKRLTHTPLNHACGTGFECAEVIKLLLARGANTKVMTIRNTLWSESVEPYHTTLHLLIVSSKKASTEESKDTLLKLIDQIIRSVPEKERKEFLERKTRYAEDESMSPLTTLEFANKYMRDCNQKDLEFLQYWRSVIAILSKYGANTSVLNDKCDINRRRHMSLEKDVKEIKQKIEKSTFEKIVEHTSLALGLTTGMFAIYELLFNEKKSKRFCLTCACVTTGLLLIFGLCKMLPSTQLTDPQVEEQTKQEEKQIS